MEQVVTYLSPSEIVFGAGASKQIGGKLKQLDVKRVLLVADKGVAGAGLLEGIKASVADEGIVFAEFLDVVPNPTVKNVYEGLSAYKEGKCEAIVAVGGGSVLDTGKTIAMMANETGHLLDFAGYETFQNPPAPLIAVPTTAGTGSEVTQWAVITDEDQHYKLSYGGRFFISKVAVVDPLLTLSMPKKLTAETGMDALTHAVEAFTATNATPYSNAFAEKAIRLIYNNLLTAYEDGRNVEARTNMMYGQMLAGLAFSNSAIGTVHGLAHQLGGLYNTPHGLANAMLLPYVMEFNKSYCEEKYAQVRSFFEDGRSIEGAPGADGAIELVKKMSQALGIPEKLRDIGVEESSLETLADMSIKDLSNRFNARPVDREDLLNLYKAAF